MFEGIEGIEGIEVQRYDQGCRACHRGSHKRAMCDERWMKEVLARRREEGTFRELRTPEQDQCFVDFTSNDYLGLGRSADLRQASEMEARRARKVTGMSAPAPFRMKWLCACVKLLLLFLRTRFFFFQFDRVSACVIDF